MSKRCDECKEQTGTGNSNGIMRLFVEMARLPLAAFVYSMEMLVKTMQGMQRMTDQSVDLMVGGTTHTHGHELDDDETDAARERQGNPGAQSQTNEQPMRRASAVNETIATTSSALSESANPSVKERREMDKDLHDDMLKLVRYKVLFVKREYEYAFPEREDLVSDNLDGSAFTAWKVAEFIQELGRGETVVPRKWMEKGYPGSEHMRDGRLMSLKEDDKKYLRVYYEVLERYPREKFKYEEQQIRVLEEIRDKLPGDAR